jgi:hypothetical protein
MSVPSAESTCDVKVYRHLPICADFARRPTRRQLLFQRKPKNLSVGHISVNIERDASTRELKRKRTARSGPTTDPRTGGTASTRTASSTSGREIHPAKRTMQSILHILGRQPLMLHLGMRFTTVRIEVFLDFVVLRSVNSSK